MILGQIQRRTDRQTDRQTDRRTNESGCNFSLGRGLFKRQYLYDPGEPGSSVGIATGYGLDGPGIESRVGARFSAPVQTGPEAHPASCTMGTGSFPGGRKWPGRDADPSPPSSAEV
jgi:hypothetical protein